MYKQIELPYPFDALEPHIDALTMETHYSKHHAAYTKVLNEVAEKAGVLDTPIEALLASLGTIRVLFSSTIIPGVSPFKSIPVSCPKPKSCKYLK